MGKQYRTCPNCGSNLDPCERCDCQGPRKIFSPESEFPNNSDVKVVAYRRWEEGNAYQLKLADGRIITAFFEDYKAALAEKQRRDPLRGVGVIDLTLGELAEYVLNKVVS